MERGVADGMSHILDALRIETDHNTRETPERWARMMVREIFAGRYVPRPDMTSFPNIERIDQLYAVGPIAVRSCCAHHLVPIIGHAWIGVLPGERLVGLSKFHRLTEWIMARPQIQEEATHMLADELESTIAPLGLAVVVRARHFCTAWRGVRDEGSLLTTSVLRGTMLADRALKDEFMGLIRGMEF